MARLKDIAERTGLSINTVSLALRQSPRIPEPTRERVLEAAHALDYMPNHAAKALVSRRTSTVGLLLTDITNPLLTQVARAVEAELKALGYVTLLAASNDDPVEELRALSTFRARQVDGMLVYPHDHRRLDAVRRLRARGMPVVLLAGDGGGEIDVVSLDERAGSLAATAHLIAMGHRRIGLLDSARTHGNEAKGRGYADALRAAGIDHDAALVVDPLGHAARHGLDAFARLMALPHPPTAVLTANDSLALGVLRWCRLHGRRVPEDVAVVGYDDIEFAEHATTPLSTVRYPAAEIARLAVARLGALIDADGEMPRPAEVRLAPELVLRASSAGPSAAA